MKPVRKLPLEVCRVMRSGVTIPTPAQGVVELVLNSIDAKALSIAVRIDLKLMKIQVIDNGIGITFTDLEAVGNRSNTSKCYSLDEYYNNLICHGYRGEALASLCELSGYLEIVTRPTDSNDTFKKLFIHGKAEPAKVSDMKRPSCGTTVTINDFMFNMPVRRSGMKEAVELEDIRSQVEYIALVHPEVSISLRNDSKGRIILEKHKSSDLLSSFEYLFGHSLSHTLAPITFCSSKFKIKGYISKEPHRHNDLQFIYINRKPIIKTKLHKFVCALLAKSSIIRSNGSWKSKPIPKNVLPERWLSFPSLEKVKKFAVFVLNITCSRDEYEISWDSKKSSIYFKDWGGILNCISESIQKFLRMENLVEEESSSEECDKDSKEQEEGKSSMDEVNSSGSEMSVSKSTKDIKIVEPAMETWNLPGVIHGVAAKRGKICKTNIDKNSPKQNDSKHSENLVSNFTTPSISSAVNKDVTFCVYNDELSSVPPVVKFLEKIETPEIARLKIVPGAYRLKMMEEENKRKQIAKKLGMFKLPCKPKLGYSSKKNYLIDVRPSKALYPTVNTSNVVKLDQNCVSKNKSNSEMKHKTKCKRSVQYMEAFCPDKDGNRELQAASASISVSSTCSEYIPKKKHVCLDEKSQGFLLTSSSDYIQENKKEETLDDVSTDVESVCYSHVEERCLKENKSARCECHSDSNCVKVGSGNIDSEISFQFNSGNIDQNNVTYNTLDCSRKPKKEDLKIVVSETPSVSYKVHSKCNNLKISEVTLISIPTPCSKNSCNVVKFKSVAETSNAEEISTENNKLLEDESQENFQKVDKHVHVHDKSFDKSHLGEASFHSNFFENNESRGPGDKPSFSSFVKEFAKRKKSKLPPVNSLDSTQTTSCSSVTSVPNACINEMILDYQNTNKFLKCAKESSLVPITSSYTDEQVMNKTDRNKNFLEIFEASVQLANSDLLTHSPYFSLRRSSNNTFNAPNKINILDCPSENSNPLIETEGPHEITFSPRSKDNFINKETDEFKSRKEETSDHSIRNLSPAKTKPSSLNKNKLFNNVKENSLDSEMETINNVFEDKQFFEIFESSVEHVNSGALMNSPYFNCQRPLKNSFHISDKESSLKYPSTNVTNISEKEGLWNTAPPARNLNMLFNKEKEFEHVEEKEVNYCIRNSSVSEQAVILSSMSARNCRETNLLNEDPKLPSYTDDSVSKPKFVSLNNLSNEFIAKEGVSLPDEIIDQDPFNNKKNGTRLDEEKSELLKNAILLNDAAEDENQLLSLNGTNEVSTDNAEEKRKEMWQEMKNFEGKNFFIHVPSGFTSFNAPFSETFDNSYGMTKRFEFIPKGLSPAMNACSSSISNFKQIGQFPREVDDGCSSTDDNDLKTIKWRNKINFGIKDQILSDIFDVSKSNCEQISTMHQSSVPDLSYTFAKMSKLLNEEKFDKRLFVNIQVIGQLDNKFIVTLVSPDQCTSPCVLGLFDQHAVHERIRLETLTKEYSSYENESICFKFTRLEEPIKLALGTKEHRIMSSFGKKFERLGFHFIAKDECVEIHDIPTCLYSRFLRERSSQWLETTLLVLIQDVVQHVINSGGQDLIFPEVLRDIINSEACKGAIKFGDHLTKDQCQELLFYLSKCDVPFFCAHGRPSFVPIFDLRVFENEKSKCLSMI